MVSLIGSLDELYYFIHKYTYIFSSQHCILFLGERIGGVRGRKQGPTGVSKVYETSSISMG